VISIPNRRFACALSRATFQGDLQPRQHRPAHIVLMRGGVTEHRQQPITLGRTDTAPEAVHDLNHLIA